jgi:hypothetical protein
MHAEQRFDGLVVPSRLSVGWRYGTADYKPFFQAHIHALQRVREGGERKQIRHFVAELLPDNDEMLAVFNDGFDASRHSQPGRHV